MSDPAEVQLLRKVRARQARASAAPVPAATTVVDGGIMMSHLDMSNHTLSNASLRAPDGSVEVRSVTCNDLTVNAKAHISGALSAAEAKVDRDLRVDGDMQVSGPVRLGPRGGLSVGPDGAVAASTSFQAPVVNARDVNVSEAGGRLTVGEKSSLECRGSAAFASGASVKGRLSVVGETDVRGTAKFNSQTIFADRVLFTGGATFSSGNVTVQRGKVLLGSGLSVSGGATFADAAQFVGGLQASRDVQLVNGASLRTSKTSKVQCDGSVTVSGKLETLSQASLVGGAEVGAEGSGNQAGLAVRCWNVEPCDFIVDKDSGDVRVGGDLFVRGRTILEGGQQVLALSAGVPNPTSAKQRGSLVVHAHDGAKDRKFAVSTSGQVCISGDIQQDHDASARLGGRVTVGKTGSAGAATLSIKGWNGGSSADTVVDVAGNMTVGTNLNVPGRAVLAKGLSVPSGNAEVGGRSHSASLTVYSSKPEPFRVSEHGDVNIPGNVTVQGKAILSALSLEGRVIVTEDRDGNPASLVLHGRRPGGQSAQFHVRESGDVAVAGDLHVGGSASFAGDMRFEKDLSVGGPGYGSRAGLRVHCHTREGEARAFSVDKDTGDVSVGGLLEARRGATFGGDVHMAAVNERESLHFYGKEGRGLLRVGGKAVVVGGLDVGSDEEASTLHVHGRDGRGLKVTAEGETSCAGTLTVGPGAVPQASASLRACTSSGRGLSVPMDGNSAVLVDADGGLEVRNRLRVGTALEVSEGDGKISIPGSDLVVGREDRPQSLVVHAGPGASPFRVDSGTGDVHVPRKMAVQGDIVQNNTSRASVGVVSAQGLSVVGDGCDVVLGTSSTSKGASFKVYGKREDGTATSFAVSPESDVSVDGGLTVARAVVAHDGVQVPAGQSVFGGQMIVRGSFVAEGDAGVVVQSGNLTVSRGDVAIKEGALAVRGSSSVGSDLLVGGDVRVQGGKGVSLFSSGALWNTCVRRPEGAPFTSLTTSVGGAPLFEQRSNGELRVGRAIGASEGAPPVPGALRVFCETGEFEVAPSGDVSVGAKLLVKGDGLFGSGVTVSGASEFQGAVGAQSGLTVGRPGRNLGGSLLVHGNVEGRACNFEVTPAGDVDVRGTATFHSPSTPVVLQAFTDNSAGASVTFVKGRGNGRMSQGEDCLGNLVFCGLDSSNVRKSAAVLRAVQEGTGMRGASVSAKMEAVCVSVNGDKKRVLGLSATDGVVVGEPGREGSVGFKVKAFDLSQGETRDFIVAPDGNAVFGGNLKVRGKLEANIEFSSLVVGSRGDSDKAGEFVVSGEDAGEKSFHVGTDGVVRVGKGGLKCAGDVDFSSATSVKVLDVCFSRGGAEMEGSVARGGVESLESGPVIGAASLVVHSTDSTTLRLGSSETKGVSLSCKAGGMLRLSGGNVVVGREGSSGAVSTTFRGWSDGKQCDTTIDAQGDVLVGGTLFVSTPQSRLVLRSSTADASCKSLEFAKSRPSGNATSDGDHLGRISFSGRAESGDDARGAVVLVTQRSDGGDRHVAADLTVRLFRKDLPFDALVATSEGVEVGGKGQAARFTVNAERAFTVTQEGDVNVGGSFSVGEGLEFAHMVGGESAHGVGPFVFASGSRVSDAKDGAHVAFGTSAEAEAEGAMFAVGTDAGAALLKVTEKAGARLFGDLDMGGAAEGRGNIRNVADPSEPYDAVNMGWADKRMMKQYTLRETADVPTDARQCMVMKGGIALTLPRASHMPEGWQVWFVDADGKASAEAIEIVKNPADQNMTTLGGRVEKYSMDVNYVTVIATAFPHARRWHLTVV